MPTLHIEHAITDFETWAAAFRQFSDARHAAGVRGHRVQQPFDDPRYVIIDLDFDTIDAAVAFRTFLTTAVWPVPEAAPALVGAPRTAILQPRPV